MTRIIAIAATLGLVALLGVLYVVTARSDSQDVYAQCRQAQVAGGGAAIGGPFTLVSEDGETVTETDVIDKPTLVYFGYTFCPDVCPLDANRNGEATAILEERGHMVKPVFISIDPSRDTPEVLKDYTDYMHPRMVGLTGSEEQVKAASKAYRTYYKKQEPEDGDDEFYLVDHSTFTYLVTPEDGFVEFFRRDVSGEGLADQVQCFLEAG